MDIGEIVKAPLADKDWVKKCAVMGLYSLIPIAGLFNLMGWMKACTKARQNGETNLPEANFSYLGEGWGVILSILPVIGLLVGLEIVVMIVVRIAVSLSEGLAGLLAGVSMLAIGVLALGVGLAQPAMLYRHIIHGDKFASLKVAEIIALVKGHVNSYFMLWVMFFIAGIVAQLGSIACFVGIIVTLPLSMAIQGIAIADFAKATNNA